MGADCLHGFGVGATNRGGEGDDVAPTGIDGDWWKWRGEIASSVADYEDDVRALWKAREVDREALATVRDSVIELRTKVAMFAALAAAGGAALPGILSWFVKHL